MTKVEIISKLWRKVIMSDIVSKMEKIGEIASVVRATEEAGIEKARNIIDGVKSSYDSAAYLTDIPVVGDLFKREEEKKKTNWCAIVACILGVVAIACVIYGIYRYFTPDYLDDFDEDFEDDEFEDDDFFEDEDKKEEDEE